MGVFHVFLNCTNGTESRNAPHMAEYSHLNFSGKEIFVFTLFTSMVTENYWA